MTYYKTIVVAIAFLFVANKSRAQFRYGCEAGIGMSSMHFAPALGFTSASKTPISSGKLGGIIDAGINKHVFFQSGILLSLKGQKRTYAFHVSDSVNASVAQTLQLNYIDLPLMLCFKTAEPGKGRIILGIGATPSYILGGRNKFVATGSDSGRAFTNAFNDKISANKPLKGFDIGVSLSAGYELPKGLFFRLYYTAGVSDLGMGTEIDKNRMWGVSLGCLFGKQAAVKNEDDDLIDRSKD